VLCELTRPDPIARVSPLPKQTLELARISRDRQFNGRGQSADAQRRDVFALDKECPAARTTCGRRSRGRIRRRTSGRIANAQVRRQALPVGFGCRSRCGTRPGATLAPAGVIGLTARRAASVGMNPWRVGCRLQGTDGPETTQRELRVSTMGRARYHGWPSPKGHEFAARADKTTGRFAVRHYQRARSAPAGRGGWRPQYSFSFHGRRTTIGGVRSRKMVLLNPSATHGASMTEEIVISFYHSHLRRGKRLGCGNQPCATAGRGDSRFRIENQGSRQNHDLGRSGRQKRSWPRPNCMPHGLKFLMIEYRNGRGTPPSGSSGPHNNARAGRWDSRVAGLGAENR